MHLLKISVGFVSVPYYSNGNEAEYILQIIYVRKTQLKPQIALGIS